MPCKQANTENEVSDDPATISTPPMPLESVGAVRVPLPLAANVAAEGGEIVQSISSDPAPAPLRVTNN